MPLPKALQEHDTYRHLLNISLGRYPCGHRLAHKVFPHRISAKHDIRRTAGETAQVEISKPLTSHEVNGMER